MKQFVCLITITCVMIGCGPLRQAPSAKLPAWMRGHFTDDYGIQYTVDDKFFIMDGSATYHILQWNKKEQYLLTQNDSTNKTEKGFFTRIDYTRFAGMEPFTWGYCFSIYNAIDSAAAMRAVAADRANPKKGCNGYPFSRMKRIK